MNIHGKTKGRKITIKLHQDDKELVKNLSAKYNDLYEKYRNISLNISSIFTIIMFLSFINIFLLLSFPHYRFYFVVICICLFVVDVGLLIAVKFVNNKRSEYIWNREVVYGVLVRQIENIKKMPNKVSFALNGNKLQYGQNSYDTLTIKGDIPNGDIVVSIQPYEKTHAWVAKPRLK